MGGRGLCVRWGGVGYVCDGEAWAMCAMGRRATGMHSAATSRPLQKCIPLHADMHSPPTHGTHQMHLLQPPLQLKVLVLQLHSPTRVPVLSLMLLLQLKTPRQVPMVLSLMLLIIREHFRYGWPALMLGLTSGAHGPCLLCGPT